MNYVFRSILIVRKGLVSDWLGAGGILAARVTWEPAVGVRIARHALSLMSRKRYQCTVLERGDSRA